MIQHTCKTDIVLVTRKVQIRHQTLNLCIANIAYVHSSSACYFKVVFKSLRVPLHTLYSYALIYLAELTFIKEPQTSIQEAQQIQHRQHRDQSKVHLPQYLLLVYPTKIDITRPIRIMMLMLLHRRIKRRIYHTSLRIRDTRSTRLLIFERRRFGIRGCHNGLPQCTEYVLTRGESRTQIRREV